MTTGYRERALKYIIIGGLFAVLFAPLFVADSLFFPFITGKAFFFRIVVEIIFAAWLVLAVFNPRYRPRRSALLIALSFFLGVLILSTIFSVNPDRSFWSNYERMEGLVSHLHLYAYFLVLISLFQSEKIWRRYFQTSVLVSVLVAGYGVAQLLGWTDIHQGSTRVDATLGNAVYLAVYMLFHIFIAAWLWLSARPRLWNYLYGPIIVLQTVILYYTATRGTILGLLGGAVVTAVLLSLLAGGERPWLRRGAIVGLIAIVAAIGAFSLARESAFVQESKVLSRFAGISLTETTTESRLIVWRMALRGFRERPVLGWGPENFNLIFNKYYDPKLWRQEQWFDRAHNIYLDWLTAAGVLGLAGYLSLYAAALWLIWRRTSDWPLKSVFTGLLAGYAFQNLFIFDNLTSLLPFLAVLGLVNFRSLAAGPRPVEARSFSQPVKLASIGIVLAATLSLFYFLTLRPLQANATLIKAMVSGRADEQLARFQKVFSYRTFGSIEASEQFLNAALRIANAKDLPNEFKVVYVQAALTEAKKMIEDAPFDARRYLFLGISALRVGDFETALAALAKAQELSPAKQTIIFELANTHLALGQQDEALVWVKRAYELESGFDEARYVYALVLIRTGRLVEAKTLLRPDERLDVRFINAYVDAGAFPEALNLWQQKAAAKPDDVQLRFHLAAAYLAVGQRGNSIRELEEAMELDPAVKDQTMALINEIRAGRNPLSR